MSNDIERCYMDRTADRARCGTSRTRAHRVEHGILEQVAVQTPGVAPKVAKQIDGCIRETIATVVVPREAHVDDRDRAVLLPAHRRAERGPAAQLLGSGRLSLEV